MKVLLLQLPIQTHDFFFSNENIPLAPAYLQVIATEMGIDADLLPGHLMRYGSDQAILKSVMDGKPDIVGMSCYLWNVERSLFLAREIKRRLSECKVVLGGPEITPDNPLLLQHRDFDMGVVGEGEEVWRGLLRQNKKKGWVFNKKEMGRMSLSRLTSPYLKGALDPQLQGVLWIETIRGCVYRCAYCYYHKQSPRLRTFPLERILKEVQRAWEKGLEEIVFLDPCFIRRPNIKAFLDGIAAINHDRRLRLYAESTIEGIDDTLAEKMARAGFIRIEAGLQSVNPKTLRRIHRSFRPRQFLEGFRCLQNQGIEVMVDLIAGLPGDSFSDVVKSMDWVVEREAYDNLMLYPLSLMPSTELKQRADEFLLSSMPYPPYLLTRSPEMTAPEICRAFRYYEECMGEDISPLEMPLALHPGSELMPPFKGLCPILNWQTREDVETLSPRSNQTTYALTISMSRNVLIQADLWIPVLKGYLKQNPFTLLSVEVPHDVYPEQLGPLWSLAKEFHHPTDRDYTVIHTPYRSFIVFSREKGLVWKWPDPRESLPLKLHDGQTIDCRPACLVIASEKTIPRWFLDHLSKRYPSLPEIRPWRRPGE